MKKCQWCGDTKDVVTFEYKGREYTLCFMCRTPTDPLEPEQNWPKV